MTAKSSQYADPKDYPNSSGSAKIDLKTDGLDLWICRIPSDISRANGILSAVQTAREHKKSHILILENDETYTIGDLQKIISAVQNYPDSIIIGKRNFKNSNESSLLRLWRHISNFWLRLQTKQALKDSTSSLRAYPLYIFDHLKFYQKGSAFELEILVKSSWANIEVKEMELDRYYRSAHPKGGFFKILWNVCYMTILNIHYTMRSVIPIPHRKILVQEDKNEKISIFRPLQSLKALLTENVTPKELAAAGGLGVFLGTLPLIGVHTMFILFASNFFRLNKVAAVSASQLCMPPIVPALCIEAGYYMRHGRFLTEISLETIGYQAIERLWEWFIGSLLLAPLFSIIIGLLIYLSAVLIQRKN